MITNKLKKDILKRWPFYLNYKNYFIHRECKYILHGVFLEKTRRGVYVWEFMYPAFDPSEEMHLTYSERIGCVSKSDNIEEIVNEYILENADSLEKIYTVDEFIYRMKSRESGLGNPHIMLGVAVSCFLKNHNEEGLKIFENLMNSRLYRENFNFRYSADKYLDSYKNQCVESLVSELSSRTLKKFKSCSKRGR